MTTGKTTKVVDKLVKTWNETIRERDAINKGLKKVIIPADKIADGWKLELIPVQHMFPNCQVKYKTKCTDMKSCDKDKVQSIPKVPSIELPIEEIESEQILHNVNGYKIDPKRDKIAKKPKGFEGW